ncbi:hypothetical protein [Campylobacter lanienae]|uniref:hypothetical protein n=1 Tax=Campylobacter lanienae TaxID=75658 RepID=UPI002430DF4C|nr:hypothetical protein [Campylobacter lanienae]MDD5785996.1 hypothetical protein [Campylobacter lanienae]
MKFLKIIIIAFSSLLLVGCYDKQIITRTEVKTIEIPSQLLEVNQIERPIINDESDIIDAYIDLYKNYLLLVDKIRAIKELNSNGNHAR